MSIGLIVSSHGKYAQEAMNAVTMIVGEPRMDVEVVSVLKGRSYDECLVEIQDKYTKLKKQNDDVLILVDMFGGTPSNIASFLAISEKSPQVYSGFNLPMLLELIAQNPEEIQAACAIIEASHGQSLVNISANILKNQAEADTEVEL